MSTTAFQERAWYKSSYSNGGADDCVEVNRSTVSHVGVRDSKLTTASPVLAIPATQWARVITAIQDGALGA